MIVEGRGEFLRRSFWSTDAANKDKMPNLKKMAVKSCPSWSQLYSVNFPEYSGYVTILEDAIKVIKVYGVNKTTSSIIAYQTKGFGNSPVGKTRYCKFDISMMFLFVFFLSSFH